MRVTNQHLGLIAAREGGHCTHQRLLWTSKPAGSEHAVHSSLGVPEPTASRLPDRYVGRPVTWQPILGQHVIILPHPRSHKHLARGAEISLRTLSTSHHLWCTLPELSAGSWAYLA